jgi:hypothetical protein
MSPRFLSFLFQCGTTTALNLLRNHDQLQALQSEVWFLFRNQTGRLVRRLHDRLPLALPRGYKCPSDALSPASLNAFRDHFPRTRLVVGIRHPIPWF